MPNKTRIIRYLDKLDPFAKKIGAVNTVLNKNGRLIGYNTDGLGALSVLKTNVQELEKKKILILGAGGASQAIAYTVSKDVYETVILNRTLKKARIIANKITTLFGKKAKYGELNEKTLEKELKEVDIVINATSIGMHPYQNRTPIRKKMLRADLTIFDLVYKPLNTKLLKDAKKAGAKTINGLLMLVHQGALSFEIWTNKKAPIDLMLKESLNP